MKITKQQIELIASAMAKELSDNTEAYEEAKKAAQPYIKSAKKSKFYKDIEQIFKLGWIKSINIEDIDFASICPELLKDSAGSWYSTYQSIEEVDNALSNRIIRKLQKKIPKEYDLHDKIVYELTLKSLGADDIYELLDEIKASIRKQFNF